MSHLARQEIYYGRQFTLAETLGRIDAVTARHVHSLAADLVRGRRLSLAAVGRVAKFPVRSEDLRL
jgi:hypothetical protein